MREIDYNFSLKPTTSKSFRNCAPDQKEVLASDLWADRCAIILIVQRPGCPLCRDQAQILCQRMEEMATLLDFSVDENSFNLVCIVRNKDDQEDVQEFFDYFTTSVQTNNYVNGALFYDPTKAFYKKMRKFSFWDLFSFRVYNAYRRARERGIKGSSKSDGNILGGLLVINKEKVWYEFREKFPGDAAPLEEVLLAFEAATSLRVDRISLNAMT